MQLTYKKKLSGFILGLFIASQVLGVSSALLMPKQAEAFGPSFTIGDIPRIIYQIAEAAGISIATNLANKFLSRFISTLDNKYKIRNYLYYDQILTNYYLSNYISDKIQDPDLRQIYGLLNAGFVTGQSTGTIGGPNPNNALIPKLKTAINNYYQDNFGIPENVVINNPGNLSGFDYYSASFNYYLNPPSYVAQNLKGQFGVFQSAATTAAQLEVIVGNGLKAGRIVGGTCSLGSSVNNDGSSFAPIDEPWAVKLGLVQVAYAENLPSTPINPGIPVTLPPGQTPQTYIDHQTDSPATCQAQGGIWQASALDNARSFIDNPAGSINKWLTGAVQKYLDTNYNPNNYKAVIGSLLGNFLFNQFTGKDSSSVLVEDPRVTSPTDPNAGVTPGKELDIDGDKVFDGMDIDGDGQLDICYYGGIPDPTTGNATPGPPCQGSRAALTATPPPPSSECSPAPTVAQKQEAQDAIDFITPLLEAIPKMNPIVTPAPQDYQTAVQDVINQANTKFLSVVALYYPGENVIGMVFNYLVGPATVVASNQVGIVTEWTNAWRVTCGSTPPPTGPTCADFPNSQACTAPDHTQLVTNVKNYLISQGQQFNTLCDAFEIVKRVAWALRDEGAGLLTTFHTTQCNGYSADIVAYPDNSTVDILIGAGPTANTNGPAWQPAPAGTESGVHYAPPSDPGDPAGSY